MNSQHTSKCLYLSIQYMQSKYITGDKYLAMGILILANYRDKTPLRAHAHLNSKGYQQFSLWLISCHAFSLPSSLIFPVFVRGLYIYACSHTCMCSLLLTSVKKESAFSPKRKSTKFRPPPAMQSNWYLHKYELRRKPGQYLCTRKTT